MNPRLSVLRTTKAAQVAWRQRSHPGPFPLEEESPDAGIIPSGEQQGAFFSINCWNSRSACSVGDEPLY